MKKNLIAGVSFGFSGIEAVICDEDFEITDRISKPYPGKIGKESLVSRVAKSLTSLKDFHLCYAVGIALPAVFDPDSKKVIESDIKEIVGENMFQLFVKRIDPPVYLFRRSFCSLLAEQAFGVAKNIKNVVMVEIGRDISASLLLGGKIYRGHKNAAGRIAETIVDITREKRNNSGNFKSLATGEGIETLTGQSIYKILKNNPQSEIVTKQIVKDLKESLITGLYNIKLIIDPEMFIITGDILENYKLFENALRDLKVPTARSTLNRSGPPLGAAIAAYNQFKRGKS